MPKVELRGESAFTDGKPPKPDGWARWDPDIQGSPGGLETHDVLLPLTGPPGTAREGSRIQIIGEQEEQQVEREEIRKKILENQVKPGDFKQTVPQAPSGPVAVLPICPPAVALAQVAAPAKAMAPSANPGLYLAPAANGEDLWTGWTVTGATSSIRRALTVIIPETLENMTSAAPVRTVSAPTDFTKPAPAPALKPTTSAATKPAVEATRNYKAAEALKSAAQAVATDSAAKAEIRQPDQPSTPRHVVFVDLSVLGIEEDEDADAEFVAVEGESPPGGRRWKSRKDVAAREALRELVSLPHAPAAPAGPKLVHNFQTLAWKNPGSQPLRLSSLPLRPKVVFERTPDAAPATEPVQPADQSAAAPKQPSSLAAAWSAKRLKKNETGVPPTAPGISGRSAPVENPVSEPSQPVSPAPPVETAKTEAAKILKPASIQPAAAPEVTAAPNAAQEGKAEIKAPAGIKPEKAEPKPAQPAATPAEPVQARQIIARPAAPEAKKSDRPSKPTPPVSKNPAKTGTPVAEPKTTPAPIEAAKLPQPLPDTPPFEAPVLGLGATKNSSFWANLPVLPKAAIAIGLVAAIGGGAWFTHKRPAADTAQKSQAPAKAGRSLIMNLPGGWSPDWGGDYNHRKNRTISFYRPSANNDDYRIEFEGQIDSKALGWVYRAVDPRNYFAYKVEFVKTGPEPGVALTHFTLVNGVESQKHYTPLSKPIRLGKAFKVRLDVRADEFSAYINDELVEVWQDDRLPKGGFGLLTELGESAQVRKMQVFELMP